MQQGHQGNLDYVPERDRYKSLILLKVHIHLRPILHSTSTSTLFNKNTDSNRLARKIAIANLGGPD